MIALDPITVGSQPFTVQLWQPGEMGSPMGSVRVANESPYALRISVAGAQHWLQAWTADVYPALGAGKMLVEPQLLTQAATPPSSQLLVTVAGQGETIPGTYPVSTDRMTSISAGTVDIASVSGPVSVTPEAGATFAVGGSIDATIQNSSLTIDGGPITVENVAGNLLNTQQPQTLLLSNVAVTADGSYHDLGDVTLPPATHALCFVWFNSLESLNNISLLGQTTGIDWAAIPPSDITPPLFMAVSEAIDPVVDVQVNFGPSGGTDVVHVWLAAVLDTQVTAPDSGSPAPVAIKSPNSSGYVSTDVGTNALAHLSVSHETAVPAPWEAANQPPLAFSFNLAAGATADVIPAPTSPQQIWLLGIVLQLPVGTAGVYGSFYAGGAELWHLDLGASWEVPSVPPFRGAPLGEATALTFKNGSGIAMGGSSYLQGSVIYSLG